MRFLLGALRHPLALFGLALTTASALLFLVLFGLDVSGLITNHYVGLVSYAALPILFVIGLLAIALGARRGRRGPQPEWPRIDLNEPRQRQVLGILLFATFANVVILSMGTYGGVQYMGTNEFCGQVCHAVMEPQYTAHQTGPHARIECVACHIGPGAGSFIGAKVSGTRRLLAVATGRHARPVRQPRGQGAATRETCERCHWSELPHGDQPKLIREFGSDETNSELATPVRLHVGGGGERLGDTAGSHWHADPANQVEYIARDAMAEEIPYVRVTTPDGSVREYRVDGADPDNLTGGVRRRMDCLDCHNRSAHTFAATPERAVDAAVARGLISRELPFVRREAVGLLTRDFESVERAREEISAQLTGFYQREYPALATSRQDDVSRAIGAVQEVYGRTRFPGMQVDWGTYPNHLGHTDSPGCFRCHDELHVADDGATISQNCDACHGFE
jgi:nitrate/TMAO reductase-like tetraheme cytochrome c subunit